nr:ABC transporter G family member 11-like [Ipomoea trifida]
MFEEEAKVVEEGAGQELHLVVLKVSDILGSCLLLTLLAELTGCSKGSSICKPKKPSSFNTIPIYSTPFQSLLSISSLKPFIPQAYVTQDDNLIVIGTLTIRETISYSAQFRLPDRMPRTKKRTLVESPKAPKSTNQLPNATPKINVSSPAEP